MDVLSDKTFISQDYISRYQGFPIYYHSLDNKYIGGVTGQLKNTQGYSVHIAKRGDTFDSIALDYYNNPTLFWVICDFNRIQDPYSVIEAGTEIKVPVLSSLTFSKN